jgi:hypothetical protein
MGNHRTAGREVESPKGKRIEGVHFISETHGTRTKDAPAPEHQAEDSGENPLLRVLTSLGK